MKTPNPQNNTHGRACCCGPTYTPFFHQRTNVGLTGDFGALETKTKQEPKYKDLQLYNGMTTKIHGLLFFYMSKYNTYIHVYMHTYTYIYICVYIYVDNRPQRRCELDWAAQLPIIKETKFPALTSTVLETLPT